MNDFVIEYERLLYRLVPWCCDGFDVEYVVRNGNLKVLHYFPAKMVPDWLNIVPYNVLKQTEGRFNIDYSTGHIVSLEPDTTVNTPSGYNAELLRCRLPVLVENDMFGGYVLRRDCLIKVLDNCWESLQRFRDNNSMRDNVGTMRHFYFSSFEVSKVSDESRIYAYYGNKGLCFDEQKIVEEKEAF